MRNKFSKALNEGAWALKFIGIIGIFYALLYVSNDFFVTYSNVAKIVSGFFLIFQIIMIIDLCYIWGEKWVEIYDGDEEYEGGSPCWAVVMIVTSLGLYACAGWVLYSCFGWFTSGTVGCGSHSTFIYASIAVVGVLTVVTLSGLPERPSIITSGAVSLYIAYLTFSALTNSTQTKDGCNAFTDSNKTLAV